MLGDHGQGGAWSLVMALGFVLCLGYVRCALCVVRCAFCALCVVVFFLHISVTVTLFFIF